MMMVSSFAVGSKAFLAKSFVPQQYGFTQKSGTTMDKDTTPFTKEDLREAMKKEVMKEAVNQMKEAANQSKLKDENEEGKETTPITKENLSSEEVEQAMHQAKQKEENKRDEETTPATKKDLSDAVEQVMHLTLVTKDLSDEVKNVTTKMFVLVSPLYACVLLWVVLLFIIRMKEQTFILLSITGLITTVGSIIFNLCR